MDVDVPAAAETSGPSAAAPASEAEASKQAPEDAGTTGASAPEPKPTVEDVFRKLPRCAPPCCVDFRPLGPLPLLCTSAVVLDDAATSCQ